MSDSGFQIGLIPGFRDAAAGGVLEPGEVQTFVDELRAQGVAASGMLASVQEAAATGPDHAPLYVSISSAAKLAVPAIVAWLHGRSGRKVKVKVGDIEVEASTPDEVARLLEQVQAFGQTNEPKQTDDQ